MNKNGFTLVEVMIAMALLSIILASVFITQTSSLASTGRSKHVLVATNLARNFIHERELRYEGLPFDKIDPKQEGSFEAPFTDYKWKLEVSEIEFSALAEILAKQKQEKEDEGQDSKTQTLMKLFEEYLKKSVRRMTVTIRYPDGGSLSDLTFTQLLVNYDAEFGTGI